MSGVRDCQRRRSSAVYGIAVALALVGAALADEMPDADFLEYLGSWSDDADEADWILVAGEEDDDPAELAALTSTSPEGEREDDEVTYER